MAQFFLVTLNIDISQVLEALHIEILGLIYTIYWGFPHMRGDVPAAVSASSFNPGFSPHAWGCTVGNRSLADAKVVFPTCVGMYR